MVIVSGEERTEDMPPVVREPRVRLLVVRDRLHGFRDRPAAAPRPAPVVDVELGSKDRPCGGGQEVPRRKQVAGGIAHTAGAEVDDGRQAAVSKEQVRRHQVAVEPEGRPAPSRGRQRFLPDLCGSRDVDLVLELLERLANRRVLGSERTPPPRPRAARRVDPAQRTDECSELACECDRASTDRRGPAPPPPPSPPPPPAL